MNLDDLIYAIGARNIWEIGVGNPSISRTRQYMGTATKLMLFEPNPEVYAALVRAYGSFANATIHNVGLYDKEGQFEMHMWGDSSCLTEIDSPAVVIGGKGDRSYVKRSLGMATIHPISRYDTGDIDVALIDTEGCEWAIISQMVSRPRLIVAETHNDTYRTPDLQKLEDWIDANGYRLIFRDLSDSWYLKADNLYENVARPTPIAP